jgi:bla regulator protein BlaR1
VTAWVQIGVTNVLGAAVLAVLAVCLGRLCRRPALSHALWLLVLVKLVTPPLIMVPLPWLERDEEPRLLATANAPAPVLPEDVADVQNDDLAPLELDPDDSSSAPDSVDNKPIAPAAAAGAAKVAREPVLSKDTADETSAAAADISWSEIVGLIWLAGALLCLVLTIRRAFQFKRLLTQGARADAALQAETDELARRFVVRPPEVWLVPGTVSPMIWGWRRYRLLLPARFFSGLDDEKRGAILAHELAHLRRGDPWLRWLELLVLALYWWCPLAWWAARELREAEEECCDAWVIWALPGCARAYAHALVDTVEFLSEARPALPPAASGLGPVLLLRRRLTMIMQGNNQRRLTWAGGLLVLALGVTLLPMAPSWAQAPAPATPATAPAAHTKARDNIEKQEQQLRELAEQLERKRAEVERLAKDLHQAKEKIAEAKKAAGKNASATGLIPAQAAKGGQDIEQRLRQLEQKVDMILHHVQALRKDQGPRPGGVAPPRTRAPGATPPPAAPSTPVAPPALPGAPVAPEAVPLPSAPGGSAR